MAERFVAIGLLTQSQLQLLGKGFDRHFPIEVDDQFSDLLAKLEALTTGSDPECGQS